uniref:Uncharacterized protein n=1 Tax=Haemonchus contortus TaxID=6289 RepID=W6NIX9_HAECO
MFVTRFQTNEIRNLEIITSGYHKTIEQLKRACIRKRITLAKATEELFIKQANHELNNSLSYLDNVCSSAVCALESRRKYLSVYTQLLKARRRVLLDEIYELFGIEVHKALERMHKAECPCIEFSSICGVHLPVPRDMIGGGDVVASGALTHTHVRCSHPGSMPA